MNAVPDAVRDALLAGAEDADRRQEFPQTSWDALRRSGLLAWAVPREYGGTGADADSLLQRGEDLASACLTTAFVLSQREAAVRLLARGTPAVAGRYLPRLGDGSAFLTVGLSQLTTSRQHRPSLSATGVGKGWRLDGEIPWVTAADRADAVVVGVNLDDGLQGVFVVPTDRPGVTVSPPMDLAALAGSRTARVACDGVELTPDDLLAGPAPQVLGTGGGGGLETSAVALGLARAAAEFIAEEVRQRPALVDAAGRFAHAINDARGRLHAAGADDALPLRAECTRLALGATQAALLVAKGAGFVAPHPAQRWARQATFFLVWSCPRPVADEVLGSLLPVA